MNSVSSRWVVTFTCILFLIGQIVLVDHISAQKLITIRGFVLDKITKNSVPNATIKLSKNRITVAEFDGKFEFSCLREDTLMITAIGYCPRLLSVHDLLTDSSKCNVLMQPVTYQLRSVQVQVDAEKKKSEILKALIFLSDMSHPFTYFSREERFKRRFAKIKSNSVFFSQNIYWEINRQLIEEISKLRAEDLDKCIIYCNTHIVLSPNDDERTITNKLLLLISDYFKRTKSEN
ncbi:MAG: peptidase associated/transthyretin-like domain-containing protein [Paludibacter sp.]